MGPVCPITYPVTGLPPLVVVDVATPGADPGKLIPMDVVEGANVPVMKGLCCDDEDSG